jgi:glycerol-3-phosphate dehydrogenase (NAD(P)+)
MSSVPTMTRVLVVGAGAWGTALAIQAARAGSAVALWPRDPARAAAMERDRANPRLPGIALPEQVRVVAAMEPADVLLLAPPLPHLRRTCADLPSGLPVVCTKGVERGTLMMPLEVMRDLHPRRAAAVLTGPNFAGEVAAGLPAAATVAATDPDLRARVIAAVASRAFRLYGNEDPVGAQVGGAAKNVVAIAAGAVIGAGLGENARAALVTRGLAEMARLGVALGGQERTLAGLSGLGDLLLTCTGARSRNFSLGVALGRGETLAAVLAARDVATEGVTTAAALVARAASVGVSLPICEVVARLLDGALSVGQAMDLLLARRLREE